MNTMHTHMQSTQPQSMTLDDGTLLSEEEVLELEMLQLENEQLRCGHTLCSLPLAICIHATGLSSDIALLNQIQFPEHT